MFSLLGEADLVVHHLKTLVSAGLSSTQLAVIAPYSLQVCIICCTLYNSCTFVIHVDSLASPTSPREGTGGLIRKLFRWNFMSMVILTQRCSILKLMRGRNMSHMTLVIPSLADVGLASESMVCVHCLTCHSQLNPWSTIVYNYCLAIIFSCTLYTTCKGLW